MAKDFFLKIDGVDGGSQDSEMKGSIDVESFSFSVANTAGMAFGSGGGVGKAQMNSFHFTMPADTASPRLFIACATLEHLKKAVLSCRKATGKGQKTYLKVTMTDVVVSQYQISGASEVPFDQVTLDFGEIDYEYTAQGKDGPLGKSAVFGYDVKGNKKK